MQVKFSPQSSTLRERSSGAIGGGHYPPACSIDGVILGFAPMDGVAPGHSRVRSDSPSLFGVLMSRQGR